MQVRAVEWRPAEGEGWAMVLPEQWGAHTVAVSQPLDRAIETPADLGSSLPERPVLVGPGEDQLTVVFGEVWATKEEDELAEWLSTIFPELKNPQEIAWALREWDSDEPVTAVFPGRTWNLFRLRLSVPLAQDGGVINEWGFCTVIALGRALLVFWYGSRKELVTTSSRIDARVRRGEYTGAPPSQPIADLASAYAVEVAQAIAESAGEAIKKVDLWESRLFRVAEGQGKVRIGDLGALRSWAVGLRETTDGIAEQISKGQFRTRWSTEGLEPIADSVDQKLDSARAIVARFRSDVSDAFEAANTVAIARQLAASQAQQERADRLEGTVTRLTAFLLVPALVATTFGANVELPGEGWVRTAIMLVAMVVGSLVTFVLLRRWDRAS